MSMIIDGTSGITFPNSTAQVSAGSVIQVVNATTASVASTSSSSAVTTGLSATITPKFSTSKIQIIVSSGAVFYSGSGGAGYLEMYRGATALNGVNPHTQTYTGSSISVPASIVIQDSPATTSATTYTLYFWAAGGTVSISNASTTTTITLMEIAA